VLDTQRRLWHKKQSHNRDAMRARDVRAYSTPTWGFEATLRHEQAALLRSHMSPSMRLQALCVDARAAARRVGTVLNPWQAS
jgi:hypothetical protein